MMGIFLVCMIFFGMILVGKGAPLGIIALGIVFIWMIVAGTKKTKERTPKEKNGKNVVCHFDNGITEEEFNAMVKCSGKGIRRIANLRAEGPVVYGLVHSQSGISDWEFNIDFNNCGKLTGKYRIASENTDSDIPQIVATRIAYQIQNYLDSAAWGSQKKTAYQTEKATPKSEPQPSASVPEEILKYKNLLDVGAITQEEYDAKKKQLLGL